MDAYINIWMKCRVINAYINKWMDCWVADADLVKWWIVGSWINTYTNGWLEDWGSDGWIGGRAWWQSRGKGERIGEKELVAGRIHDWIARWIIIIIIITIIMIVKSSSKVTGSWCLQNISYSFMEYFLAVRPSDQKIFCANGARQLESIW